MKRVFSSICVLNIAAWMCLVGATTLGAPSIQITSLTPAAPWYPGDIITVTAQVAYAEAPSPGRIDFVFREVGENDAGKDAKLNASGNATISFNETAGSRSFTFRSYALPHRTCYNNGNESTTTPRCLDAAALADTLTRLKKIVVVARLLDGSNNEVATAIRDVELIYPEVGSLSGNSHPFMSSTHLRVVVPGAHFTQPAFDAGPILLNFYKADDPKIGLSVSGYARPDFNGPCSPPPGGTGSGGCNFKVIDDSTVEFELYDFRRDTVAGVVVPDSALQKYFGTYDLHVSWTERHPAGGDNVRYPDAVLLGAYSVTEPRKEDLIRFTKINVSADSKTQVILPGSTDPLTFPPGTRVTIVPEFEYKLTRREGSRIWFVIRKQGETTPLAVAAEQFFTTTNQVVTVGGQSTPRLRPLTVELPADSSNLEVFLVMTDIFSPSQTEHVFTTSQPMVLNLGPGPQPAREIQLWQKIEIATPTEATDGPPSFKVEFVRMAGGIEIREQAPVLAIRPGFVTVRVPPALLGSTSVSAPPLGTDPQVHVEVIRAATGQEIARQPLVLRFPQPMIVDELDVRSGAPVGLRTLTQFVLGGPSPNIHTFSYLGRSSDGMVGLRVLNTELRFPVPLRFETDDVVVFEPDPATARLRLVGALFHIPGLGPGNQGLQFNVSQNGLCVFAIEANATSPGPFPARYQLHLAGNVGLPRKLINGVEEIPRGIRLDTLFNHPAPRGQGLFPGDIGVARTALYKFANVASISQFAQAVLIPPADGFTNGTRIVRAADPTAPLEITTPTAQTPDCAAPVLGTVIDFTQVPYPEPVVGPSPALSETMCAVIGENDGNGLTLPKTFANGATVSSVILDLGSGHEIVDGTGADFEVLAASGDYTVSVGNTPYAQSFVSLPGTWTGVQQIDLAASGLKSARYVWITGAPSVVLDAVRSLNLFADDISASLGPITHVTSATILARRAKDAANLLDPFVQLIAPDGALFAENEADFGDDLSPDLSDAALIQQTLSQDGFYRSLVKGYDKQPDNQSAGTFFTRLETSGHYDPIELSVSNASEAQTPPQKTGTISSTRQRDSFLFQAAPGSVMHIVLNGKNSPADFDPVVELYDPEDFLIGASDNGTGRGKNPALSGVPLPVATLAGGPAPNPSTYRVVVSAVDGFGSTSALTLGKAHVRQAIAGSYELKVFTGAPSGGGASPRLALSAKELSFETAAIGQVKDLTLTITNAGGAELQVQSIAVSSPFTVLSPSAPFTVAAGAKQTVTFRFAPTASRSEASVAVLTSNDPEQGSVTVSLSGVGSPANKQAITSLHNLSLRFQRATGTAFGEPFQLELTSVPVSQPANGELYPALLPSYASTFIIKGAALLDPLEGQLFLDLPRVVDANRNELDDFFEVDRGVTPTTTAGSYTTQFDEGTVTATWSRPAGSKTGTCHLELKGDLSGLEADFTATFELLEYSGLFTYTPGADAVNGNVQLTQRPNGGDVLSGPLLLNRVSPTEVNQLDVLAGAWINATGKPLEFNPSTLKRSTTAPSNFRGELSFRDGDPATAPADYSDWTLLITDTNDSDADGIPDLIDSPAVLPPVGSFSRVALEGSEIVLEWHGNARLEAADTLTGQWLEVHRATSPHRLTPAGARKFFRLTM